MSRRELRRVMPAIAAGLLLILAGLAMPLETREILRQRLEAFRAAQTETARAMTLPPAA